MLGREADGNGGTLLEHFGRRTVNLPAGLSTMYWMKPPWNSRRLRGAASGHFSFATSCCPRPIADFDMPRSERLSDLLA
jgi:hypothetical protein